jgi:hypothetical protein
MFYSDNLKISYKGFSISKDPQYHLYFIEVAEGKKLPPELSGRSTGIMLLEKQIDRFLNSMSQPDKVLQAKT